MQIVTRWLEETAEMGVEMTLERFNYVATMNGEQGRSFEFDPDFTTRQKKQLHPQDAV